MPLARRLLPFLMIIATAVAAEPSGPGELSDPTAIRAQTEAFMASVADNRIEHAYQQLRPFLGVAQAPFDQSATEASAYFQRVTDQVGQPLASVLVRSEGIGDEFYRETWLQKFNAAAIAWTFTFYQPDTGWKLVGVSYSTDLEALYQVRGQ
ncbi:hypothetical protein [Marinobacter zhejiangensis]|uniref:DUF4864 domain-containing protein n=1 Tax=Marinobacter zhejiangensis TaxID=488535 RepID=A0A1I4TQ65_9GAMM|nr:hypothetical protein [Marinobacter zhejiangensis]SFM78781.1 hypothetical protein SAMN04487963_3708 [Marinobacter zhejiangensis]